MFSIDIINIIQTFTTIPTEVNLCELLFKNLAGKLHRKYGPAVICYYYDGGIQSKSWYENGKKHRIDKPAAIYYCGNGRQIIGEMWYENGKRHRINNPADIMYDDDDSIMMETWYEHGKIHRINNPASIEYCYGMIKTATWYENGIRLKHKDLDGTTIYKNGKAIYKPIWDE